MHVIGTAGHVDHGKSALVRALTGTEPDRWIEERLRGMTLDLGFAHLRFEDGVEAGIIDVPGHERFVHNMLAGAAGMELLLLVIAANEGIGRQTREHLAILEFLSVRHVLIVLTKRDLVDGDTLARVSAEVRTGLAGTLAEDAPLFAVSTLTGEGLPELRAAIHGALLALPPRAVDAPAVLPVDRVFALDGHGTVITGTLMQGTLQTGSTLRLTPPGRDVRLRALHVFGSARDTVGAGARVAVNVPAVSVDELRRGAVLADPAFAPLATLEVLFRAAAGANAALRRRTPVRVALGAGEVLGTLVFDTPPLDAQPVAARLHLREAIVTYPGAAFVARALSPKTLLGGGTITAAAAVVPEEAEAPDAAAVRAALAAAAPAALTPTELSARANLRAERVAELVHELAARGAIAVLHKPEAYLDRASADALSARIAASLERREREAPWMLGATSLAMARELQLEEGFLVRVLAAAVDDGRLAARAGYYATLGHAPQLSEAQQAFFERAVPFDPAQPHTPAPFAALLDAIRQAAIPGLMQAFDTLVATGALVRVGGDVYRGTQIAAIREGLEAAIRRDGPITMARFRDAVGTTRKHAVPLMEWFDATGVTIRDGDVRALRAAR